MATIKQAVTLKHQANLGEDVGEVELTEGEEVTILKEWAESFLIKNADGKLFHVPKQHVEA